MRIVAIAVRQTTVCLALKSVAAMTTALQLSIGSWKRAAYPDVFEQAEKGE